MNTRKNIFISKIQVLLLIIVYKVALDLSYFYYISPTFGYEGFTYNINWIKLLESYIFTIFISVALPLDEKKPSTIALNSTYIIMILPILSIYALKNEARLYFYGVLVSFIIAILTVKVWPTITVRMKFSLNKLLFILLIGISIAVYGTLIILNGVPSLKLLDFNKVYDIRSMVKYGPQLMTYLVNWQGIIINPFLLIIFLKNKNKFVFLIMLFMQVMLYLITSQKSFLFYPLILPCIMFLIKRRDFIRLSIIGITSLIIGALSLLYMNITSWIAVLSIYRTLFLPAQISFQYYEYFSKNGFVLLSHSIFKKFFSTPIYNDHPVRIIGREYYYNNFPNTGYLGDAYMNFGIMGMIVFSILFGIILKSVDSLSTTDDKKIISGAFMVILMITFSNAGLLTTLLTGGMLFYMLLLWLYNEKSVSKYPKGLNKLHHDNKSDKIEVTDIHTSTANYDIYKGVSS